MSKLFKATAAASMLLFGATVALAQTQNPDANPRPLPPDGSNTQPYDQKSEPTNEAPGVGSRPIGPPMNEPPTDPNANANQPMLKKLDKEGRGGQQN